MFEQVLANMTHGPNPVYHLVRHYVLVFWNIVFCVCLCCCFHITITSLTKYDKDSMVPPIFWPSIHGFHICEFNQPLSKKCSGQKKKKKFWEKVLHLYRMYAAFFFLIIFSKQYNVTAIYIVLYIISNLEMT